MSDHADKPTTERDPGFTWADHGSRIDARCRAIWRLKQVAPMELPQATWDRLDVLIVNEIGAGLDTPDEARDAWRRAISK